VKTIDSRGKSVALALSGKNNNEDPVWRTVWIRAWTKDSPPPDIGQPIRPGVVLPGDPGLPVDPALSQINDAINLAGGVLSIIDLGIDIAATYSAAAGLAAASTATGVGGLFLTALGGIIGMPALWASVDKLAEYNGQVQGYADAMQDMAEGYKDDSLERKPVRDWPKIVQPQPHVSGNTPTSTSQGYWIQGQRKGCTQAYLDILKVEANPVQMDATIKGQTRKVKINGKFMLRGAWVSTKGEVSVAVIKKLNEKLKAAKDLTHPDGRPPFPTR
jgi:hypothetical protein